MRPSRWVVAVAVGVEKRDKLLLTLLIKKLEIKLEYFFPYWHLLNGGLSALFCLMLSQ